MLSHSIICIFVLISLFFPPRSEEDDPIQVIQKELERLEILDAEEAAQLKAQRKENLPTENYFGDKLLHLLNEKEKNRQKEPFKPYR